MLGETVDVAKILGALRLEPMEEVSYYFPEAPVKKKLHLVVQAPRSPGKYQPCTTSRTASRILPGTTISPSSNAELGTPGEPGTNSGTNQLYSERPDGNRRGKGRRVPRPASPFPISRLTLAPRQVPRFHPRTVLT